MITRPVTDSETSHAAGAAKRKRKRRRSPGGLGRGLARILTDSTATAERPASAESGLLQLVGGESSGSATKVRKFVVDTALTALADAFDLDGVILAAHPGSDVGRQAGQAGSAPTVLAATLPPSWSLDSQLLFEVYGNLWRVFEPAVPDGDSHGADRPDADRLVANRADADRAGTGGPDAEPDATDNPDADRCGSAMMPRQWQSEIDQHHLWVVRLEGGTQPVAVMAVRSEPLSPPETQALVAVISSIVDACSETEADLMARRRIRAGTSISLKSEGTDVLAEVVAEFDQQGPAGSGSSSIEPSNGKQHGNKHAGGQQNRRTGVGRGCDTVSAVARGAAKACRPRCEITFAGASDLEDTQVTVVMIRDGGRGLRLGFAVRPNGDPSGAAEAVFTAATGPGRVTVG